MYYEDDRIQQLLVDVYILLILAVFRGDDYAVRFDPFPSVAVSLRQHLYQDK